MKNRACLRSGFCCKKSPCGYGEWNHDKSACKYLGGEKPGKHFCMKYDHIQKQPTAEFYPAFGFGCCSAMNSDRRELVRQQGESYVDYIAPKLKWSSSSHIGFKDTL